MYNRPITQRAKSPLKQTAVKEEDGGTSQVTKVIKVDGEEKTVDQAKGGKQAASAGDYLTGS
jgi:hypothetical protein